MQSLGEILGHFRLSEVARRSVEILAPTQIVIVLAYAVLVAKGAESGENCSVENCSVENSIRNSSWKEALNEAPLQ